MKSVDEGLSVVSSLDRPTNVTVSEYDYNASEYTSLDGNKDRHQVTKSKKDE